MCTNSVVPLYKETLKFTPDVHMGGKDYLLKIAKKKNNTYAYVQRFKHLMIKCMQSSAKQAYRN